ncbi:ADP-ribosylglycohydrolase [Brachyspira pilosicoli WesB]|uniref:ADP-ribosylglycohydrolase n=1 Tax=Brachyspira pilosicoli WesB TaxID=1161918 RepID=K0JHC0_BRAPL|nr:ADP-ribosylglycohydrolase family protein [Brachyspira pilosicoli]CCG56294.1 ADP-ribosylglycohydrolase [Brachyspira pilosicoli WesB]
MLGAIIGDIVGSVYEYSNIKTKDFDFFSKESYFTDDTVMTIAVADAIMNGGKFENYYDSMKRFGNAYIDSGYGYHFLKWLTTDNSKPYNSWGNGSAMRVSPCAYSVKLVNKKEDIETALKSVREAAKISAEVTHNHIEGIKGAQATAESIYYMRYAKSQNMVEEYKKVLKRHIEDKYKYDLNITIDDLRDTYEFDISCQGTVPQAIVAFLESVDFEDAIRNAISIGGDSDTLAAITGSIAEAAYGISSDFENKALSYLDNKLCDMYYKWNNYLKENF